MNLQTYVETQFASFDEVPFNELDAAVLSQLAMVRVELAALGHGVADLREDGVLATLDGGEELRLTLRDLLCAEFLDDMPTGLAADHVKECLVAAAMSPRYRQLIVARYQTVMDGEQNVQFSATTFTCPHFTYVGYRGTDSSLTGWHEDFNLAFMNPVPGQTLAVKYLKDQLAAGVHQPLYLGGHSKGGNLVEYIVLTMPPEKRGRIARAYSFDGPGFKENAFTSMQFLSIEPVFTKLVPQDSIIGMILDSESAFDVVQSSAVGFMQHDLFSWDIEGEAFVRRSGLTHTSRAIDDATRDWIHSYSDQEISAFVEALFHAAESSGALDLETLFGGGVHSVRYLRAAANSVDDQCEEVLKRFATDLAEALGTSAKDEAEETLKNVYDKAKDKVEDKWHALRDSIEDRYEEFYESNDYLGE